MLAPRQLGKSSLMMRTSRRLVEEGVHSVIIDLTQLGTQLTAEAWYLGLLAIIEDQLLLETNTVEWWKNHAELGYTQRLTLFFEKVLLVEVASPIVIFVDEIDTTLSLSFTDDFFASIRYFYQARVRLEEFQRLSFVLIGVATPGDLIHDPTRTPFNIGQRLDMTDFTFEEALPLADGLGLSPQAARQVLEWVLGWTGGHPYLTQRLCQVLTEQKGKTSWTTNEIDELVNITFLQEKSGQDNNLQFVRDMLTKRAANSEEVLRTYRSIRAGKRVVMDQEQSVTKSHLKLSGVVKRTGPVLQVRNSIYRTVFDEKWIKEHLPINWGKRLRQAWGLIAASLLLAALMGGLAVYAFIQQGLAQERAGEAENERAGAVAARATADSRRSEAEQARLEAEGQKRTVLSEALITQASLQLDKDPELSILLAVESVKLAQQPPGYEPAIAQSTDFLRDALAQTQLVQTTLVGLTGPVNSAVFSPDGRFILTADNYGKATLWLTSKNQQGVITKTTQLFVFSGHTQKIWSAAFSPDSRYAVTASEDATVIVWDTQSGQLLVQLKGHTRAVNWATFSPDGHTIVTASEDGTARLWSVPDGQERAVLNGHSGAVTGANFSPDGRYVATGSVDGTARLWSAQTGQQLMVFNGHSSKVVSAVFSPDGQFLLTASIDLTARLWQIPSGQPLAVYRGHTKDLTSAIFSPDGTRILTTSSDGTARLWDANDYSPGVVTESKELHILKGSTNEVYNAVFSPDGRYVVTAGNEAVGRVWDVQSGKGLGLLKGFTGIIFSLAYSPDGLSLLTASSDGIVRVWEGRPGGEQFTFKGQTSQVLSAAISADGQTILSTSFYDRPIIWDVRTGKQLATLPNSSEPQVAAFSPDEHYIITSGVYNQITLWDRKTGLQLWQEHGKDLPTRQNPNKELSYINAMFSPDSKLAVVPKDFTSFKLIEIPGGKELKIFSGHTNGVDDAAFSPDGKNIVTTSLDNTTRIWEVSSGKLLATYPETGAWIGSATFSPDSRLIITAGLNGTLKVWEVETGKQVAVLKGHTQKVYSAAFSPKDGRYILSASIDGTIKVWETQSGKELASLKNQNYKNYIPSFSPDGNEIVAISEDGTARIWSTITGKELATLKGSNGALLITIVAKFSADGRYVITVSKDNTIQIYPVDIDELLKVAQARLSRSLTPEERLQYGLQ